MKERLLIVGGGMASAYLLESLSAHQHRFDITVICEEERACYNRVLLSSVLAGEKREQDLGMLSTTVTEGVRMLCGTRIERLDLDRRVVHTHRNTILGFDKLVLATGSRVALPALSEQHIDGIEVFRSLDDTRHLRSFKERQRHVVVVGGGLLGLEAAHGLNGIGCTTTVVHRNRVLMNRQLDEQGGHVLQGILQSKGLAFYTGAEIEQLYHEDRRLTGVSLRSGEYLPCDTLLFATGITPCVDLARESRIKTDRGILIDKYLQTSAPGVFALGECAQLGKHCFGLVAPVRAQAQVLAEALCGVAAEGYQVEDWPTQLKISGVELFRAGILEERCENVVLSSPAEGVYRRLAIKDDRLVGAVLVGDKRHGSWYSELIKHQTNISAYRSSLMFGPTQPEALNNEEMAA